MISASAHVRGGSRGGVEGIATPPPPLKSICLLFCLLDPSSIRGQAYDGASAMSSEKEGVQAKINEISPLAPFTHCYAHCLNLSVAATCKLSEVRDLIGLINVAYLFLNNSTKRQKLFELARKEYPPENSHRKLPGLCKTRWVERHTCLDVFLEMYGLLLTFLDVVISPNEYPNLKSSAGCWNWEKNNITNVQGLKASCCHSGP